MAKKRIGKAPKAAPASTADTESSKPVRGEGLKLVRLELSDADHKRFRVESAKEGLPMALMAKRLVIEWMESRDS
jgi:hypothetical protein